MDNNLSTILQWNQCVCVFVYVSPHFFELNQNGHNSANFEARTFRFCMVVDLEEHDEEDNEDEDDNNNNIFAGVVVIIVVVVVFVVENWLSYGHFGLAQILVNHRQTDWHTGFTVI